MNNKNQNPEISLQNTACLNSHCLPIEDLSTLPPEAVVPSLSSEYPELVREHNDYPEVIQQQNDGLGCNYSHGLYPLQSGDSSGPIPVSTTLEEEREKLSSRRYFGLQPRTLVIVIVLAVVIIAAVVGGTVGGVLANKRVRSPTPASNPPEPTPPLTIPPEQRAVAAAECDVNIFVVYQVPSGELDMLTWYRNTSKWYAGQIPNASSPKLYTPITTLCWALNDYLELRVYYVTEDSILQEASAKCNLNATGCYNWHHGSITGDVHVSTPASIAAVTPVLNELNLFIRGVNGIVSKLQYKPPDWSPIASISNIESHPSSPIAAVVDDSVIQLFWVNPQGQLRRAISSSSWEDQESLPVNITQIPGSIEATLSRNPAMLQVIYTEGTEMKGIGNNMPSTSWSTPPSLSSFPTSYNISGAMAAVGWDKQETRLYYVEGDDVIEMAYGADSAWRRVALEPIPYS